MAPGVAGPAGGLPDVAARAGLETCIRGALNGVSTASTPFTFRAALVSIDRIRARGTLLVTITAVAGFDTGSSAENLAPPVTLSRPSTRSIGAPSAPGFVRSLMTSPRRGRARVFDARAPP